MAIGGEDLIRNRRFVCLTAARLISVLGDGFGRVALAFAVLGLRGASAGTLSAVLAAQAAPQLALVLAGGLVADRMGRARVMVAAELAAGLAWGALAVAANGAAPAALLAGLALVAGTAKSLFQPALAGLTPLLVADASLQRANAVVRVGQNLALVLGLACSGAVVATLGARWALALNAVSFFVSAGLLAAVRGRAGPGTARRGAVGDAAAGCGTPGAAGPGPVRAVGRRPAPAPAGPGSARAVGRRPVLTSAGSPARTGLVQLREGAREFFARQWLWAVAGQYAFVVAAVNACVGVLGPLTAARELGGARAWSLIAGAQALGTLAGAALAIRVRARRPIRTAVLATFPAALPMMALASGAPVLACCAAMFVAGVASDVFGVLWTTTVQREVPEVALSRVSSFDLFASLALAPVALAVAGPAATVLGVRAALLGCAGLAVVPTMAALLSPQVRRLEARPAVSPAAPADGPAAVPQAR